MQHAPGHQVWGSTQASIPSTATAGMGSICCGPVCPPPLRPQGRIALEAVFCLGEGCHRHRFGPAPLPPGSAGCSVPQALGLQSLNGSTDVRPKAGACGSVCADASAGMELSCGQRWVAPGGSHHGAGAESLLTPSGTAFSLQHFRSQGSAVARTGARAFQTHFHPRLVLFRGGGAVDATPLRASGRSAAENRD